MRCPECDEPNMTTELLRPDPHEAPSLFVICPCGHSEPAPADTEADQDGRPRMPGF